MRCYLAFGIQPILLVFAWQSNYATLLEMAICDWFCFYFLANSQMTGNVKLLKLLQGLHWITLLGGPRVCELIWEKSFLRELGMDAQECMKLYSDNKAVINRIQSNIIELEDNLDSGVMWYALLLWRHEKNLLMSLQRVCLVLSSIHLSTNLVC